MTSTMTELEQQELLHNSEVFKIKGRDKHGRKILRIIGKFFPGKKKLAVYFFFVKIDYVIIVVDDVYFVDSARLVSVDVLKNYLEERIFPKLGKKKFAILYIHTDVQRSENFPGISSLRSIYDAIPANVKENLEAVYFIHPGLQARLFLATFGRFLFNAG